MARFELPVVQIEVAALGTVTVRGLKFSERVSLFEESGPMFAAKLTSLAALVEGEQLSPDEWDSYGGLYQDDYVALVQAASEQSGLIAKEVEKK